MTGQNVFIQLASIIANVIGAEVEEITADKSLTDDLEIDSLFNVEIMVCIEDEFGLGVSDQAMSEFVTVGDVAAYIEREITRSATQRRSASRS